MLKIQDNKKLQQAANEARGLAIDAIEKCASGHLGLPLGCAEIGAVLFSEILNIDPSQPKWLNRDRFILSAGHGSMFIYSWLHLSGFNLSIDDLKNFRIKGSKTPGHPEFEETEGVEATSGPLGQGIGNAVGMAISEKMAEARFNTADNKIFDHKVWCLAGDGCMQEGVSAEAAALAGTLKLGNLVVVYDSNDVTLDAMADKTMAEDTAMRFTSYGWEVSQCNGHDIDAVRKTFNDVKNSTSDKPKLVICKTIIAKGIEEVQNCAKGHGEGGAKFAEKARKSIGLPDEKFYVSQETYALFNEIAQTRKEISAQWQAKFDAWKSANPEKAKELDVCLNRKNSVSAEELLKLIPTFPADDKSATRASSGVVMNALAKNLPYMITGSADLFGSTKNYLKDMGDFSADNNAGRNLWFGIREHAMGAIVNGIAYYGLFEASCATFLTFAGYMMGSIRVSALSRLPVQYVFTHDSVGVGMDGPTHQPVEMASILRCIPRLNVIRPADSEECAAAWACAVARKDGPTALILSRQNLPLVAEVDAQTKRMGTLKGAYVAKKETEELKKIVIATGSELSLALKVAKDIPSMRVVSMPSMEIFDAQPQQYKDEILSKCEEVVAVEAGVSALWYKYANRVVATDDFGFSADAPFLFDAFGFTEEKLKQTLA
ncbi:MAG: transketolase [Verrucomicrobiaceae bacterium]|nr:transketolase [Verrucomicrobiaceae bacterium]